MIPGMLNHGRTKEVQSTVDRVQDQAKEAIAQGKVLEGSQRLKAISTLPKIS